jgi:hypothetical protein
MFGPMTLFAPVAEFAILLTHAAKLFWATRLDVPIGKSWIFEGYVIYTQFFQSAAVSSYVTFGAEVGHHFAWNVEGQNIDFGHVSLGTYSEIGNRYSSGHVQIGSAWRF